MRSLVEWGGKRSGSLVPAIDSQQFRHMVADGTLRFKHIASSSSSPTLSLNELESVAGREVSFMDRNFRVILTGSDARPQGQVIATTLPRMPSVNSLNSDVPTMLSDKIQDIFSLVWKAGQTHHPDTTDIVKELKCMADAFLVERISVSRGSRGGFQYGPQQMLATVKLSDLARDLEQFGELIRQAIKLVLQPILAEHILAQLGLTFHQGAPFTGTDLSWICAVWFSAVDKMIQVIGFAICVPMHLRNRPSGPIECG